MSDYKALYEQSLEQLDAVSHELSMTRKKLAEMIKSHGDWVSDYGRLLGDHVDLIEANEKQAKEGGEA